MIDRRKFLKNSTALSALKYSGLAGALSAFASSTAAAADTSGYKALVCVFFFGGQDGYDTVLPKDAASYNQFASFRAGILEDYESLQAPRGRDDLVKLNLLNGTDFGNRDFALPNELGPIKTLFDTGKAAIIANVGPLVSTAVDPNNLPAKLFSHNDQQSTWMSLSPEGAGTGWGGSFVDPSIGTGQGEHADSYLALSLFGSSVFLSGIGVQQFNMSPSGPSSLNALSSSTHLTNIGVAGSEVLEAHLKHFNIPNVSKPDAINRGNLFNRDVATISNRSLVTNEVLQAAIEGIETTETFEDTLIGTQLKTVAKTIKAKDILGVNRQVFFVGVGGFDTHDDQAVTLSNLQSQYANAIGTFFNEIGEALENNVTLFTASDFGRTLVENGNGTDHGWGSHHFVIGGAVNGQKIYGDMPPYELGHANDTGNGRLIPKIAVEQYAAPLGKWFGLSDTELRAIFPLLEHSQEFPDNLPFMNLS